jgi:hypothetical protein
MAVERERPLPPDQSAFKSIVTAGRAVLRAISRTVTLPLLLLAPIGWLASRSGPNPRARLLAMLVLGLWSLALLRLHATGGYCAPRHTLIASQLLILSGGAGLSTLVRGLVDRLNRRSLDHRFAARRPWISVAATAAALAALLGAWVPEIVAPINGGYRGYRQAGEWVSAHAQGDARILDPKGWALYYSGRPGYTFASLADSARDPGVRWVIAHDALLKGPWDYCTYLRQVVGDRKPVWVYPSHPERGTSRVYIFDLAPQLAQSAPPNSPAPAR